MIYLIILTIWFTLSFIGECYGIIKKGDTVLGHLIGVFIRYTGWVYLIYKVVNIF